MAETNEHPCPKTGCDKVVPFDVLACKAHWFELPTTVRRSIARAWRNQEMEEWAGWRKYAVALLNGERRYVEARGVEQLSLDDPHAVERFRPQDPPLEPPAGGWQDG